MPIPDKIVAFAKKYLALGIISQVLITAAAAVVALIEGFILFIVGVAVYFPLGNMDRHRRPNPSSSMVRRLPPLTSYYLR
jgi:hypothetical protein